MTISIIHNNPRPSFCSACHDNLHGDHNTATTIRFARSDPMHLCPSCTESLRRKLNTAASLHTESV